MYKLVDAKKVLTSEGIWNDVFDFLNGIIKSFGSWATARFLAVRFGL
jgi:hypothetical protein